MRFSYALVVLPVSLLVLSGNALADEYPKVVRSNGQVCVQSLDAQGAVVESCRADAPAAPSLVNNERREVSLRDDDTDDAIGARRGITEYFGANFGAAAMSLATNVACASGACSTLGVIALSLVNVGVSSALAAIFHSSFKGRAGFGWSVLGNLIGNLVSVPFLLFATSTGGLGLAIAGVLVAAFLPPLGSVIALEVRDTVLRRQQVTPVTALPGDDAGLLVTRF